MPDPPNQNRTVFQPSPLQQRAQTQLPPPAVAPAGPGFATEPAAPPMALPDVAASAVAPPPAQLAFDDIPSPPVAPTYRNPIMVRAAPFLALLASVRTGRALVALPDLHRRSVADIDAIHADFQGRVDDDQLRRTIYVLAATADDIALNLPLPEAQTAGWAQNALIPRYFNERIGGDRAWDLLEDMLRRPETFQPTLEVYHACMAAGFEGRYRVMSDGRHAHYALMQRVFQALEVDRTLSRTELSPHWRGEQAPPGRVGFWAPLAVAAAAALGVVLLVYVSLLGVLWWAGKPARDELASLNRGTLTITGDFAPAPPPDAAADRVRTFLAPEIAAGLVEVPSATAGVKVLTTAKVNAFDSGSDTISDHCALTATIVSCEALFDRIALALKTEAGPIHVVGFTDNTQPHGAYSNNLQLSQARADTVATLIRTVIADPHRQIDSEGGGESPLASNDTPEGRAQNRHVEISLDESAP